MSGYLSSLGYLDQLSIACDPGLLGVRVPKLVARVPKPRYLELDQLSLAQNPGLLVARVPKPRYLELDQLSIASAL